MDDVTDGEVRWIGIQFLNVWFRESDISMFGFRPVAATVCIGISTRWFCLLCAIVLVAAVTGCGGSDEDPIPIVEVKGVLLIDGAPAEGVNISCLPTGVSGEVNEKAPTQTEALSQLDGTFSLSQFPGRAGIVPGEYALTFVWMKMIDSPSAVEADKDFLDRQFNSIEKSPRKFTAVAGENIDLGTIELKTQ